MNFIKKFFMWMFIIIAALIALFILIVILFKPDPTTAINSPNERTSPTMTAMNRQNIAAAKQIGLSDEQFNAIGKRCYEQVYPTRQPELTALVNTRTSMYSFGDTAGVDAANRSLKQINESIVREVDRCIANSLMR